MHKHLFLLSSLYSFYHLPIFHINKHRFCVCTILVLASTCAPCKPHSSMFYLVSKSLFCMRFQLLYVYLFCCFWCDFIFFPLSEPISCNCFTVLSLTKMVPITTYWFISILIITVIFFPVDVPAYLTFLMYFRMAKAIVDAILGLSMDDFPSTLAASALFYVLASDVSLLTPCEVFFPITICSHLIWACPLVQWKSIIPWNIIFLNWMCCFWMELCEIVGYKCCA